MSCHFRIRKLSTKEELCEHFTAPNYISASQNHYPHSQDLTLDTPSQTSNLTESSDHSSSCSLQLENEILEEQLKDKLFSYRLSNQAHLNERKKVSNTLKMCKVQFEELQESAQDVLKYSKTTKQEIESLGTKLQSLENFEESQSCSRKKLLIDELISIQNQITRMDQRVTRYEENSIRTQWEQFLFKDNLEDIKEGIDEKLMLEKEGRSIICSSCSIF